MRLFDLVFDVNNQYEFAGIIKSRLDFAIEDVAVDIENWYRGHRQARPLFLFYYLGLAELRATPLQSRAAFDDEAIAGPEIAEPRRIEGAPSGRTPFLVRSHSCLP
jgi:hypothetical protein